MKLKNRRRLTMSRAARNRANWMESPSAFLAIHHASDQLGPGRPLTHNAVMIMIIFFLPNFCAWDGIRSKASPSGSVAGASSSDRTGLAFSSSAKASILIDFSESSSEDFFCGDENFSCSDADSLPASFPIDPMFGALTNRSFAVSKIKIRLVSRTLEAQDNARIFHIRGAKPDGMRPRSSLILIASRAKQHHGDND